MASHDADKTGDTPASRRTMTRDPNATSGPVVLQPGDESRTIAGSTHLTTNIDGKWYVCNPKGEPVLKKPFDTETEAVAAAQERNGK